MVNASPLKRFSAISLLAAFFGLSAERAVGQEPPPPPDLVRSNQDELASFYGRMNVVVGSGARAFGMGGAFLAQADDATAASWNPAGLSYLRRFEFSLVGVKNDFSQRIPRINDAVVPTRFVTTRDELNGSVVDFAGFAFPLRIKDRSGAIQVSYQRSFSFEGQRSAQATVGKSQPDGSLLLDTEFTVDGDGGFDTVSLSSGFEVFAGLRVGFSANKWINGFKQTVDRPTRTTIDSEWKIEGNNFNFGALYTPTSKVNVGAVLKTPFTARVNLTKSRTDRVDEFPDRGRTDPTTRDNVQIRFPRVYGFGVSVRPTNTLTLSADFTRTAWSQATITNFFSLAQNDVTTPKDGIDEYPFPLPFPAVEEGSNGQADTNQIRVGTEWVLRLGESGRVLLPLRAGIFRDGQPVVKRLRAGVDAAIFEYKPAFTGLTAGVGVTIGGVLVDVAFIREYGKVPISRAGAEIYDANTSIKYNRVFASMMVRFGQRR